MIAPKEPVNEAERVGALRATGVLDTPPEERFDRLTRLARRMFNVPIALVSLVDANRQWFKSCIGLDASETGRDISFCGHAILGEGALVIEDAQRDERFSDNPLVTGEPFIRFYAGHPIVLPSGLAVGTLCLIDSKPRFFSTSERSQLSVLAHVAADELGTVESQTTDPETQISNGAGFFYLARHALEKAHSEGRLASRGVLTWEGTPADLPLLAADLVVAFSRYGVVGRTGPRQFEVLALGIDTDALRQMLDDFCVRQRPLAMTSIVVAV